MDGARFKPAQQPTPSGTFARAAGATFAICLMAVLIMLTIKLGMILFGGPEFLSFLNG